MAIDPSVLVPGRLYEFTTVATMTTRGEPVPRAVRIRTFVRTCIVGAAGFPTVVCVIVEDADGRCQTIAVDLLERVLPVALH